MNLQENIHRIQSMMGVVNEDKNIKSFLFSYWDKNGFSNEMMKDMLTIDDNDWSEYVKEYLGDEYESVVKKDIIKHVNSFTECDGDVFGLEVSEIFFGGGTWDDTSYSVNIRINPESEVFNTIDMDDWEEIITTIGQIEGCVENYLNNTIYGNYGAFNHNTLIEIG
jgi:hypothetical protein